MVRIILNADDIGYSEAVTLGIIKSYQDGIIRSTTMMSNMPAAPFAAQLLKENPGLYCGQHSNIVIGTPVSDPKDIPSLVDEEGHFNVKSRLKQGLKLDVEDIKREVRAQAERFKELMGHYPTHIEGHAVFDPGLSVAIREVATELQVHYTDNIHYIEDGKMVQIRDTHHSGWEVPVMPKVGYYQDTVSLDYWLNDQADLLSEDLVEIHSHPGYIDQELLDWSFYNITRAKEVQIACNPALKNWAEENDVHFISFNDIKKK
ncbi:ChbG/HpnK family deacetylase [Beduini massiliensis]|uniref:ChbG/HpnK family deacetylase n=1 Tax=Beduini massiliensis TaxID=1585974 RepID=UPI00059AA318|nr:ChbG/HpnK family deacetylase [Beduini massiliensis]